MRLLPVQQLRRAAFQNRRGSGSQSAAEWWFLVARARPLQQTGPDSPLTGPNKEATVWQLCGVGHEMPVLLLLQLSRIQIVDPVYAAKLRGARCIF